MKSIVILFMCINVVISINSIFAYDWIIYPQDWTTEDLNCVDAEGMFIVGDNGVFFEGDYLMDGTFTGWYPEDSPTTENLHGVSTYHNLYIVGDSGVIFWDDLGIWQSIDTPTTERLNSVCVYINYGFIVGDDGTILYGGDGDPPVWELYPDSPTTQNLYSVSGDEHDINTTWVVGAGGTILDYQDGVWILYPTSPTSEDLFSVFVGDEYDHPYAWSCGANGNILRWDGSSWSKINNIPTSQDLYGIWGFCDVEYGYYGYDALLCVGAGGMTLESIDEGLTWYTENCPVTVDLHSVGGYGGDYAWAVGDNGTILSHGGWYGAIQPTSLGRVKALYYGSSSVSQKQPMSQKLPANR